MQDDVAIIIKNHFKEYKQQLKFLASAAFSFSNRHGFHPITSKRGLAPVSPDAVELRLKECMGSDDAVAEGSIESFANALHTLVLRDHRIVASAMLLSSPDTTIQRILQPECVRVYVEWCMDAMMEQDASLLLMCLQTLNATVQFPGSDAAFQLIRQVQKWIHAQDKLLADEAKLTQAIRIPQVSAVRDRKLNPIYRQLQSLQTRRKVTAPARAPKSGESRLAAQMKERQKELQQKRLEKLRQEMQTPQAQPAAGVKRSLPHDTTGPVMQRQPKKLSKTSDTTKAPQSTTSTPSVARKPTGIFDQPRARPAVNTITPVQPLQTGTAAVSSSSISTSSATRPPPPLPAPPPSLEQSRRRIKWADEVNQPLVRDDEPLPRYMTSLPPAESEAETKADSSDVQPTLHANNATRDWRALLEEEKKNERERLVEGRRNRTRQLEEMKPSVEWRKPTKLPEQAVAELSKQAISALAMQERRLDRVEEAGNDELRNTIPANPSTHPAAEQPPAEPRPIVYFFFEAIDILPEFLKVLPPAQLQSIAENHKLIESCKLPNGKIDEAKLKEKIRELNL